MSNMSYCRFRNTLIDLEDCFENIEEIEDLSPPEARARQRLIKLCHQIAAETEDEYEEMLETARQKAAT